MVDPEGLGGHYWVTITDIQSDASVVGTLAKQKKAFDRCARRGAAFAVRFTWSRRRTRKVRITHASHKRARKCIGRALKRLRPVLSGTCSMVLLAGKRPAAEKAAARVLMKLKKARLEARKRAKRKAGKRAGRRAGRRAGKRAPKK